MKAKDKVALYQEIFNKGCFATHSLVSTEEKSYIFSVDENPSRKFDGVGEAYFGLVASVLIHEEGKKPELKKFFDRSYKQQGRSLNDVRENAYSELFNITIATFLITALNTPQELLYEVSNPKEEEVNE